MSKRTRKNRSNGGLAVGKREVSSKDIQLEIERLRFGERLGSELEASPACLGARVPALLLLPLPWAVRRLVPAAAPAGPALRVPFFHALWHLFVIAGSAIHFWGIYWLVGRI